MNHKMIKNIVNDNYCSWINDLSRRSNIKNLDKDNQNSALKKDYTKEFELD